MGEKLKDDIAALRTAVVGDFAMRVSGVASADFEYVHAERNALKRVLDACELLQAAMEQTVAISDKAMCEYGCANPCIETLKEVRGE